MLNFNSKIVTIATIVMVAYILYQQYKNTNENTINDLEMKQDFEKVMSLNKHAQDAKFTITMSPNKKYEDYTFLEKIITYLCKPQ